jgi:hypothetical protein
MDPAGKDHVTKRDGTPQVPMNTEPIRAPDFPPSPVEEMRHPHFSWMRFLVFLWVLGLVGAVIWIRADNLRERAKVDAARTQMKVLANAVLAYRFAHAKYPERLEDLLGPLPCDGAPYHTMGIEAITTPWGGLYGYAPDDPDGPMIFCTTPRGKLLIQWL